MSAGTTSVSAEVQIPAAHAVRRPPRDRRVFLGRVLVLAAVGVVWAVASTVSELVPTPWSTVSSLIDGLATGWLRDPMFSSLKAITLGFVIAVLVGVPIGLGLGMARRTAAVVDPFLTGAFAVPRVVLYPVILTAVGVGTEAKVWMAVISAFFPIVMNTAAGVSSIRPILLKVGRSFGCSRTALLRLVVVPAATPALMVGARIGLSISFISVIVAELFAATDGLGLLIQSSYGLQQYPRMFAVVLLVTALAFVVNLSLWALERRLRRASA